MTERSVPWSKIEPMLEELTLSKQLLAATLGVSRNTVGRWASKGEAPVWLFRLLHLEIEVKQYESHMEVIRTILRKYLPPPEPGVINLNN